MTFSEAERENAPQLPRVQDSGSNKADEALLAFKADLPHLQKLLAMQPQANAGTTDSGSATANRASSSDLITFLPPLTPTDRRHTSPWGTAQNDGNKADGMKSASDKTKGSPESIPANKTQDTTKEANDADKPKAIDVDKPKAIDADKPKATDADKPKTNDADKPKTNDADKPKANPDTTVVDKANDKDKPKLPDLTVDNNTQKKVPKDRITVTQPDGQLLLPTVKISETAASVLADLQHWLDGIAAQAKDAIDQASKKPDSIDSKEIPPKTDAAPEAPPKIAQPLVVEGINGASWKQEGSQWNFYDKLGQKVDKYEGKAVEVTKDSEGNAQIKLSDGRNILEKKDGSTLEYDTAKHLKSITYSDGTSRKFQWDGNELVSMISKQGEWTRSRDENSKLKNEWMMKGQTAGWQGELKVDEKTGEFTAGANHYRSDLSVEKINADGSREITHANKELVKISKDGLISEINYADGSIRKFSWTKNPDAKGEDDKYTLTGLEVNNNGKFYYHSRQDDGKWKVQTWENNKWGEATPETKSFKMDNKTAEYTYTDSTDGISFIRQPGGIEKSITRDGASLEYKDGNLVRVNQNGKTREFDWKDKQLVSINDGIQGKTWKPAAGGGWESDKGDKRTGIASSSTDGEIEFKDGDKSSIIKMDGAEYNRVVNEKEKSQVDVRNGEVQVKAGDGSSRIFKTAPDGKEVIKESVTRDGKTESWTRGDKLPNGNYNWVNDQDPAKEEERVAVSQQDGKLSIEYPDGRKYQANTSGAERLENSKEGWYTKYRDGLPAENKYPDGTIRKFTFDGSATSPNSIEVISPDGTKTNIDRISDGVYNYKSGSTDMKWNVKYTVSRDGTYKYVDKDEKGKITTRKIDGLTVIENPTDKSRIEKYKDEISKVVRNGKEVEVIRDKDKSPIELKDSASNTSYKKNESGEWVASAIDAAKPFGLDKLSRKGDLTLDESGTVNFITSDGTQIRQKPGERGQLVSSKEETLRACLENSSMTDAQKVRFRKDIEDYSARTDIAPKDKAIFEENLAKVAARTDISAKEKADTYNELMRLLESNSDKVFNAKERAQLAEQLVWHIANPQDNAQGANPNCQVTVIRGRLLYEKPSQFARMMTDVITTGKFVTKDGSTIKVPSTSLKVGKGSEESTFPPEDGSRTWLGKISDVTCANIHWQRQTTTPSGEVVPAGQLVYRQDPPTARKDTGARVYKEPGDGYIYPQNNAAGKLMTNPTLYAKDIADTYKQIAGPTNNVILAANRGDIISGPGVGVLSEDQLHNVLSREKGVHIAQIWTGTDWVWKEPGRKYGIKPKDTTDDEHVVLVKDYDPVTRTVAVDNSWSSKYDHNAKDRRITLHELYKAMAKQE